MRSNIKFWIVSFFIFSLLFPVHPENKTLSKEESARLISALKRNMGHIQRLACRFDQEKHLELFQDVMTLRGWCFLQKPKQIRWEYVAPIQKIVLIQEDRMKVYKTGRDGERQAVISSENEYLKIVYGYIMAFFQGEFVEEDDYFRLVVQERDAHPVLLLEGKGKLRSFVTHIVMDVSPDRKEIRKVSIHEPDGNYTLLHFHTFVANPNFKRGIFEGHAIGEFSHAFD